MSNVKSNGPAMTRDQIVAKLQSLPRFRLLPPSGRGFSVGGSAIRQADVKELLAPARAFSAAARESEI
jgi:hypothetical protein